MMKPDVDPENADCLKYIMENTSKYNYFYFRETDVL